MLTYLAEHDPRRNSCTRSQGYIANDTDQITYVQIDGADLGPLGPHTVFVGRSPEEYPYAPPPAGAPFHVFKAFNFVPDAQNSILVYVAPDGQHIPGRAGDVLIFSYAYTWEQLRDRQWRVVISEQKNPEPNPTAVVPTPTPTSR